MRSITLLIVVFSILICSITADLWTDSFKDHSKEIVLTHDYSKSQLKKPVDNGRIDKLPGHGGVNDSDGDGVDDWESWEKSLEDEIEDGHEVDQDYRDNNDAIDDGYGGDGGYDEQDVESPSFEDNESIEQELPSDIHSYEYVQALKSIGMKKLTQRAKGITYSFYNEYGGCKSPLEIQNEVKSLDFDLIRIYDTDCDGIGNILKIMKPDQQLFAGIYYLDRIEQSVDIIAEAVEREVNGNWSAIDTVSVGNELVNFDKASVSEIEDAIVKTKELLYARGFRGAVVTTDTLVAVQHHPELCSISDFVSVNSHPYWDGYVKPEDAGPWLKGQLEILAGVCGVNVDDIVLAETGWPKRGQVFGANGVPSKDNQFVAIKSIVDTLGKQVILFTAADELWKQDGSHGVEKFWGLFDE